MVLNRKSPRNQFLNPQMQSEIPQKCTEIPRMLIECLVKFQV